MCVDLRVDVVTAQVYGPSAWWWEVEELVRKLLLSAVVVLIEPGSPLQVCGRISLSFVRSRSAAGATATQKRRFWQCNSAHFSART